MENNLPESDQELRRVLVVSFIFPPMVAGGVHRMAQTCKYLPEFGWMPTVLTVQTPELPNPDYQLLEELSPEINVVRANCPLLKAGVPNQPHRQGGSVGLLRKMKRQFARLAFVPDWQVAWYPAAIKAGKKLLQEQTFDAVLATYGPATNLLIGSRLAKLGKLPLVLDFRDTWAHNPMPIFASPVHRKICQRMESRFVRQAKQVIAVSEPMAEQLAKEYQLPAGKVHCITNGYDPADADRVYDDRTSAEQTNPFRITFTGSVYGNVHFTTLFEVMKEMAAAGEITPKTFRLEFVGNMTMDEPQQIGVADFIDNHAPVPHKQVFDFFAKADVLLLNEMIGYHARCSYASKLFDYLLSGKPILALTEESEMTARVVREAGGKVIHPQDKTGIRAALQSYLQSPRPAYQPVDIQAEPYRAFDRRRLTSRMSEVLNQATGQPTALKLQSQS